MKLNSKTSALVLIDLQKGILGLPLAPHSATDVFARASSLTDQFRSAAALVVRVRVAWASNGADALQQAVDQPMSAAVGSRPADWSDFPDQPEAHGDLIVTKRQWGAFYGTDLDLQLRRRGIKTIVLGGIATNFGVESTARNAWELGYEVIAVEDISSSLSVEMHEFSFSKVMPRIARVSSSSALHFE